MISESYIHAISEIQKKELNEQQALLRAFLYNALRYEPKESVIFVLLSGCKVTFEMLNKVSGSPEVPKLLHYAALIGCDDDSVPASILKYLLEQGNGTRQTIRMDMLDSRFGLNIALDEVRVLYNKLQEDPNVSSRVQLVPLSSAFHIPGYDNENSSNIAASLEYRDARNEFFKKLVDKVTGSKDSWPQGYHIE